MIYTRTGRIWASYGKHVLFRAWPCPMPDPFRDISDPVIVRLPSPPHLWRIQYWRSEHFWDNYSTHVLKVCINLTASGWPVAYCKNIRVIYMVGVGHSQASLCGICGRQTSTSMEGVGYVTTQLSCILFIMLTTTCFGYCGPSSGHKNVYTGKLYRVW